MYDRGRAAIGDRGLSFFLGIQAVRHRRSLAQALWTAFGELWNGSSWRLLSIT
jgi:hypothetical protein